MPAGATPLSQTNTLDTTWDSRQSLRIYIKGKGPDSSSGPGRVCLGGYAMSIVDKKDAASLVLGQ